VAIADTCVWGEVFPTNSVILESLFSKQGKFWIVYNDAKVGGEEHPLPPHSFQSGNSSSVPLSPINLLSSNLPPSPLLLFFLLFETFPQQIKAVRRRENA
jgi:hypothetical protein